MLKQIGRVVAVAVLAGGVFLGTTGTAAAENAYPSSGGVAPMADNLFPSSGG
ncbi:hypothetical protein [Streptomyces sp. NPDC058486]|uniref:hypothetical protein n=1 Tax=unclassified Streptomyces TaxID=2593676 RepID=UPI0036586032